MKRIAALVTSRPERGARPHVALEDVESGTGRLAVEHDPMDREALESGGVAVEPGTTLLGKLRPYLAKVWLVDRPVLASGELMALVPGHGIDSRWFAYLCGSRLVIEWCVATSDGTKMPRTSWEKLGRLMIGVPSPEHQRAIADYLDAETARIDALVAKKRRLVDMLVERQMSLMSDGASGKLTSTSLQPASVRWIDTRGTDWREAKLTLVAKLGTGHTPSREHPEWWVDCTVPWITTGEVVQMRSDRIEYILETRECISLLGVANSSAVIHPAGTVVLCRTASAGYSAIMGRDMATSQDFVTWTCGPLLRPRFLLLCLRVMRQDLLGRLAMGSTHKTIYMPDVESIRIVLPPPQEQDRIVTEVWRQLAPLHQVADRLENQITLLLEHRQALITAAVTGELAVPGVAA